MSNTSKDHLFTLIKSLDKAEKRNFKLYANRLHSRSESKFVKLFDALDRLQEYDEDQLLAKLKGVTKRNLANLKRHLYKQLLISLRLIYIKKNIDIEIREQIDFARILYSKGMYMQALRLLDRIKQTANEHHQDILHLEILEFEKLIEARHITRSRSVENKMERLLEESSLRSYVTHTTSLLSNLNIQIQGWYIQHGHVQRDEDKAEVKAYFDSIFPDKLRLDRLTFFDKVHLFQAYMWYHYIRLELQEAREKASQWLRLFEKAPQMAEKDPTLYVRGLYYELMFSYLLRDSSAFAQTLPKFEAFCEKFRGKLNANAEMTAFVYFYLSRLNEKMLLARFDDGLQLVPRIHRRIESFRANMDTHRILLFNYKIGYLYFGTGRFAEAIDELNKITVLHSGFLRDDLHFNARILHLICHFELGHLDLLDYLIPQVQRALRKGHEVSAWQEATLQFLRRLLRTSKEDIQQAFRQFKAETLNLQDDPFECKAVRYLDIPAWVECHLHGFNMQEYYAQVNENVENEP